MDTSINFPKSTALMHSASRIVNSMIRCIIDNLRLSFVYASIHSTPLMHFFFHVQFFLPFPYSRSYKVLWRVFDKLFTDFRDCFSGAEYHDALSTAKSRFQPVPSTWLGH